ncbi:tRNA (adenosine(37)-N6)-threonylcarbamoyltransferase complex dimerization subunit type 1 TsaB [Filimonas lacunae]|nr:tRNA (adenosine(37)-N6)-threonylcarbamoyltransferase complex dimerization subunit type 1 TsaB [Filimonas lacunae]BAV09206.1 TsaB protein, required for threonylcarbamoyladenosine (t(6)A) formation in tRNA [Filimonas lacunae]
MGLILNIDTATENAGVCLAKAGVSLAQLENKDQKSHASFLQPAIKTLMEDAGFQLSDLDAIAVTAGPGSYTGLRVGLSSAKGLCFALNKPLLLLNTLEVMATAYLSAHAEAADTFICPMIDARRMEVFTALYNTELQEVTAPAAMILDANNFEKELANHKIVFCGNGSPKWQPLVTSTHAVFSTVQHKARHLAILSWKAFEEKRFSDLAYSEPLYIKEFFTPGKPTLKGV